MTSTGLPVLVMPVLQQPVAGLSVAKASLTYDKKMLDVHSQTRHLRKLPTYWVTAVVSFILASIVLTSLGADRTSAAGRPGVLANWRGIRAVSRQLADAGDTAATQLLRACLQEPDPGIFTAEDFVRGEPPRLKMEAVMSSRLPRADSAVTFIASASVNRQGMIAGLCKSYGSVISLATYVYVLMEDLDKADSIIHRATAEVRAEFERMERDSSCQLDIMVFSERVSNASVGMLFPVNALRNMALLAARTELVLLGDMDMLAGLDLRAAITDRRQYHELLQWTQKKHLVVIPTFEAQDMQLAYQTATGGKSQAAQLFLDKTIDFFGQGYWPLHGPTNYTHWAATDEVYTLYKTSARFEPWCVGRRHEIGAFDVRYRGFGNNKYQHQHMLIRQLNFTYVVHPRAYMVHRPHSFTKARNEFIASRTQTKELVEGFNLANVTNLLFARQIAQRQNFRVTVSEMWERCIRSEQLPQWRQYRKDIIQWAPDADARFTVH